MVRRFCVLNKGSGHMLTACPIGAVHASGFEAREAGGEIQIRLAGAGGWIPVAGCCTVFSDAGRSVRISVLSRDGVALSNGIEHRAAALEFIGWLNAHAK